MMGAWFAPIKITQRAKLVTFPGVSTTCQFVVPEKRAQEVVRFIKEQGKAISRVAQWRFHSLCGSQQKGLAVHNAETYT